MWRWSRICDKHLPVIVKDCSNDIQYTLDLCDFSGEIIDGPLNRISLVTNAQFRNSIVAYNSATQNILYQDHNGYDVWEGHLGYPSFKEIIGNNIPCIKLHEARDSRYTSIKLEIVMFLTGNWDDIFLVHPYDLTIWSES